MRNKLRLVIDANVFVSFILKNDSVPGRAVFKALEVGNLLLSKEVLLELIEVFAKKKFDRYTLLSDRIAFLRKLYRTSTVILPNIEIKASLDPKDNKYLELAVCGRADFIVSGDKKHLLTLSSFQGIPILSPRQFIELDIQ